MKLFEIWRIPVDDYGDDNLVPMREPRHAKALPGGSGLKYTVTNKPDRKEIILYDQGRIVAELDLVSAGTPTPMWQVEGIVADNAYQGRGLGMALYGIALSILKLTLKAGDTQTVNGQRMWLKLNQIPGVEVKGITNTPKKHYRKKEGQEVLWQSHHNVTHTFPIKAGSKSMKSGERGRGLYNTPNSSMIARWTGKSS